MRLNVTEIRRSTIDKKRFKETDYRLSGTDNRLSESKNRLSKTSKRQKSRKAVRMLFREPPSVIISSIIINIDEIMTDGGSRNNT